MSPYFSFNYSGDSLWKSNGTVTYFLQSNPPVPYYNDTTVSPSPYTNPLAYYTKLSVPLTVFLEVYPLIATSPPFLYN